MTATRNSTTHRVIRNNHSVVTVAIKLNKCDRNLALGAILTLFLYYYVWFKWLLMTYKECSEASERKCQISWQKIQLFYAWGLTTSKGSRSRGKSWSHCWKFRRAIETYFFILIFLVPAVRKGLSLPKSHHGDTKSYMSVSCQWICMYVTWWMVSRPLQQSRCALQAKSRWAQGCWYRSRKVSIFMFSNTLFYQFVILCPSVHELTHADAQLLCSIK